MAFYRFCFLKSGQMMGDPRREFVNLDAVDGARKLAKRFEIDVRLEDKGVGRVNEGLVEALDIRGPMAI